jgi:hypothetical protein
MQRRMRWSDLSDTQRFAVGFLGAVELILLIAALSDIRRRPADQIRGSKQMWTALSFIEFFGPIAYFLVGRRAQPALPR